MKDYHADDSNEDRAIFTKLSDCIAAIVLALIVGLIIAACYIAI